MSVILNMVPFATIVWTVYSCTPVALRKKDISATVSTVMTRLRFEVVAMTEHEETVHHDVVMYFVPRSQIIANKAEKEIGTLK